MPVWGLALDQQIIFCSGPSTKTANLVHNPNCTLHLESGDEVVIVEGTGHRLNHASLPDGFLAAYKAQYDVEFDLADPKVELYQVAPDKIMAWDESDFAATTARWRFDQTN